MLGIALLILVIAAFVAGTLLPIKRR